MAKIMSKGSRYRKTNHDKYSSNWDRIFNKKNKEEFETQCRELYGDSMPDVEDLEKTVREELHKLGMHKEAFKL